MNQHLKGKSSDPPKATAFRHDLTPVTPEASAKALKSHAGTPEAKSSQNAVGDPVAEHELVLELNGLRLELSSVPAKALFTAARTGRRMWLGWARP